MIWRFSLFFSFFFRLGKKEQKNTTTNDSICSEGQITQYLDAANKAIKESESKLFHTPTWIPPSRMFFWGEKRQLGGEKQGWEERKINAGVDFFSLCEGWHVVRKAKFNELWINDVIKKRLYCVWKHSPHQQALSVLCRLCFFSSFSQNKGFSQQHFFLRIEVKKKTLFFSLGASRITKKRKVFHYFSVNINQKLVFFVLHTVSVFFGIDPEEEESPKEL